MELGYAYLLSRGYIFRICLDNLAEASMEVVLVLDFRAEGLPIGMGAVMMNSKILLVGGEMVKKDITLGRLCPPNVLDLEYGDEGVSSCVYEFDPLRKHSSVSITIPQMRGAKGKPKIAIIGGKIFVLGSRPHCWLEKFPSPAFECYNISCGGEWEELPEPPHYRDKNPSKQVLAWQLSGYFVIGRKIYMRNCFGLSVFDVDTGEWKDRDRILGENYFNSHASIAVVQNGIPIPYTGDGLMAYLNEFFNSPVLPSYIRLNETTSIAVGQNGIVIAYTRDGLMAYLHEIDGTLKLEQHLYQIDDNFEDPQICRGFVFYVRDGIFCFIWSLCFDCPVRVTTFLVNVRDGYIEPKVMQSHKYHFSLLVPDFDCCNLENVFIVRGEEKLKDPLLADVYDHWLTRSVSGPPPEPRFAHGAAAIEDQMYILGGVQGGIYLNDLHALDMRRWTWSKVEVKASGEALKSASPVGPAPCARHSLIPIPWGVKRLLLIAGLTKDPSETIEVKQFDLQSAVWSTLKTHGKPPVSRGGQSVTLVGKRLVVFGGEDAKGPLLNDLHILDLETLTWGEIDSTGLPPSPRSDHSAAVHADRYLFIFGGSSHTACLNDLHVLDLQTLEWSRPTEKGEIPSPRAGHAGITIGQNWFIAGGGDKRSGVSDTIVLNMSTLVWSVVTTVQSSSPLACEGLSLVLGTYRGLHMLVSFGGCNYDGQCSNEVNVLKPSYKIEPLQPQVVTEEAAFPVDCRIEPKRRWKQGSYTSSGSSSPDCT